MISILDSFLTDNLNPELKVAVTDACSLFELINLEGFEDELMQIMLMSDLHEATSVTDQIFNNIKENQRKILKAHEVVLISDLKISDVNLFIRAIILMQDYSDYDTLKRICNLPVSSEEIFAELTALVTHKEIDEVLYQIESVGRPLIGSILDYVESKQSDMFTLDVNVNENYMKKLRIFLGMINTTELELVNLLQHGLGVGYDFITYVKLIGREKLEAMDVGVLANELMAASLISNDGTDNPISVVSKNANEFLSDIDKITKLDIKIKDLILAMQRLK